MRMRNVKNKEEIMASSKVLIRNPKDFKGKWNTVFNNNNPIYIEIGMGKGNFIIENAKEFPNINFIGIEKFDSVISYALKKVDEIPNLRMIRMDALEINEIFMNEIDKIYLNFSDPWPKKRHHNRRLTSHIFLTKYDEVFKSNPFIEMKTDNQDLFEYSVVSLSTYFYQIRELYLDLHNKDIFNINTEYEEKFTKLGNPIYKLVAIKDNTVKLSK